MTEPTRMPEPVEAPRKGEGPRSVLTTVIRHGLVPVGLVLVLVFVVPKFEEIFKGLGLRELPTMAQIVIAASHFAKRWFIVPLGMVAVFVAADVFIYYRLKRSGDPVWYRIWGVLILLIEGAAVLVVMLALLLPLSGGVMTTME